MITILFDGIAYGALLFVLAVGLSVTLGLMNFINLAHGVFAMAGGYIAVISMQRFDVPFIWCLPLAFVATAAAGALAERFLYRPMYQKSHLDQVLFSIGLTFMAVAATQYVMGAGQQTIQLPQWLRGRSVLGSNFWTLGIGHYRLFLVGCCLALMLALQYVLVRTRIGSRLRAAVDDPVVARGLGINVNQLFFFTFAVGSGLAGLGGALGTEILGLDSTFALRFLLYFLIVVALGGSSSIVGPFMAALLLGVADVAGKYYMPKFGSFIVYSVMIVLLVWRPHGLVGRRARQA